MSGWFALWRTLTRYGVRATVARAAPLYATVAIVAAIVFGGNGMHPRHVTQLAVHHTGPRIALWLLWLVASAPAARSLFVVPETFALRALPAPRALLWGTPMVHVLVAELPWALLWGIGEGWMAGVAGATIAVAAHGLMVAQPRSLQDGVASIALLSAIAAPLPPFALLPIGLLSAPLSTRTAWLRAPERWDRARNKRSLWFRIDWLAIAEIELRAAWRAERNVFLRGAVITLIAAAAAALGIRNNSVSSTEGITRIASAVLTGPLCAALGGIAASVVRAERRHTWLLASLGAMARDRMFAASSAVLFCGTILGALHGTLVAAFASTTIAQSARLVFCGLIVAIALSLVATAVVRLSGAGPSANDRIITLLLGTAIVGTILTAFWAEFGAVAVAAIALPISLIASRSRRIEARAEAP